MRQRRRPTADVRLWDSRVWMKPASLPVEWSRALPGHVRGHFYRSWKAGCSAAWLSSPSKPRENAWPTRQQKCSSPPSCSSHRVPLHSGQVKTDGVPVIEHNQILILLYARKHRRGKLATKRHKIHKSLWFLCLFVWLVQKPADSRQGLRGRCVIFVLGERLAIFLFRAKPVVLGFINAAEVHVRVAVAFVARSLCKDFQT